MATINAASSSNNVNRIELSKSTTMLRYSDRALDGSFNGLVRLLARTSLISAGGLTATRTNPFTIA